MKIVSTTKCFIITIIYVLIISVLTIGLASPIKAQAPNISYNEGNKVFTVGTVINALNPTNTGGAVTGNGQLYVSTLAGSGLAGDKDGIGTEASFNKPEKLAVDAYGNVYVADAGNYKIRLISPNGIVSTLAGSGVRGTTNGIGAIASFSAIIGGLAVDNYGNVYVYDNGNQSIRKINPLGVVSTFYESSLSNFFTPIWASGIAIDSAGNLFVTDQTPPYRIRKISPSGSINTLAENSTNEKYFKFPYNIALDSKGNMYVVDMGFFEGKILKVTQSGTVTIIAGHTDTNYFAGWDGKGTNASFAMPNSIAIDATGNLIVGENVNKIRKIDAEGEVTTLIGYNTMETIGGINFITGSTDGTADEARFREISGIAMDKAGNIYVADKGNNKIRKISYSAGYRISPALPLGLNFDASTGTIYGTPLVTTSPTNYLVTATNTYGSSSYNINISTVSSTTLNIKSFEPSNAAYGSTVTIIGAKFTGATAVSFGASTASSFTIINDTTIVAVVGTGSSGNVSVSTGEETATKAGFTYDCTIMGTPIRGVTNIIGCSGNQVYTVDSMLGAVSYNWSVPIGVTIVSGQGTRSLTVAFGSKFLNGTITVAGVNHCGNTATSNIGLTKTKLVAPVAITGATNLCEFTTAATTYSIPAVAGAASYIWSTDSGTVVTNNGTSAHIRFNNAIASPVRVIVSSGCTQVIKTLAVKRTLPKKPGQINGPTEVCGFTGTLSKLTYSIAAVNGATSYTWTVPIGASVTDFNDGGTSAFIVFDKEFVSKSAIQVQATAGCGSSAASRLVVAKTLPAKPANITLNTTDICAAILNNSPVNATAANVATASGYVWTLPTGVTLNSQSANTASLTFDDEFVTATPIQVRSQRACGQSAAASLTVKLNKPAVAATVGGPRTVAAGATGVTYTANTTNVTRYSWTLPVGFTVTSANADSSSITVNVANTFKVGSLTVIGKSLCGAAPATKVSIARGLITGRVIANTAEIANTESIKANVYPNPNNGSFVVSIHTQEAAVSANIHIINIYGQVVATYKAPVSGGQIKFNVANNNLSNGMYIVKYTIGSKTGTSRVVIQK